MKPFARGSPNRARVDSESVLTTYTIGLRLELTSTHSYPCVDDLFDEQFVNLSANTHVCLLNAFIELSCAFDSDVEAIVLEAVPITPLDRYSAAILHRFRRLLHSIHGR